MVIMRYGCASYVPAKGLQPLSSQPEPGEEAPPLTCRPLNSKETFVPSGGQPSIKVSNSDKRGKVSGA